MCRQQRAVKVRTPLQLYVRHLILEKLKDDPVVVEGVIKQLRKLPWQVRYICVEKIDIVIVVAVAVEVAVAVAFTPALSVAFAVAATAVVVVVI